MIYVRTADTWDDVKGVELRQAVVSEDLDDEGGSTQKDDKVILVQSNGSGKYDTDVLRLALLATAQEVYKNKPGTIALDSVVVELRGISPATFIQRVDQVLAAVYSREPRATW